MFDTVMGSVVVFAALVYVPGLLVMMHPRVGAEFPRMWGLVLAPVVVVFAALNVLGLPTAAGVAIIGAGVLMVSMVAAAILARQNLHELRAREARVLSRGGF